MECDCERRSKSRRWSDRGGLPVWFGSVEIDACDGSLSDHGPGVCDGGDGHGAGGGDVGGGAVVVPRERRLLMRPSWMWCPVAGAVGEVVEADEVGMLQSLWWWERSWAQLVAEEEEEVVVEGRIAAKEWLAADWADWGLDQWAGGKAENGCGCQTAGECSRLWGGSWGLSGSS